MLARGSKACGFFSAYKIDTWDIAILSTNMDYAIPGRIIREMDD